jgi:hypothetical protein
MYQGNVFLEGDEKRATASLDEAAQFALTVRGMKDSLGLQNILREVDLPGGVHVTVFDGEHGQHMTVRATPAVGETEEEPRSEEREWFWFYAVLRPKTDQFQLKRRRMWRDTFVGFGPWQLLAEEIRKTSGIVPFARYSVASDDMPVWVEEESPDTPVGTNISTYRVLKYAGKDTEPVVLLERSFGAYPNYVFEGRRISDIISSAKGFYLFTQENYKWVHYETNYIFRDSNGNYGFGRTDPYVMNFYGAATYWGQTAQAAAGYVGISYASLFSGGEFNPEATFPPGSRRHSFAVGNFELEPGHYFPVFDFPSAGYQVVAKFIQEYDFVGGEDFIEFYDWGGTKKWERPLFERFPEIGEPRRHIWTDYAPPYLFVGLNTTDVQSFVDPGQRTFLLGEEGQMLGYYQPEDKFITTEGSASSEIVLHGYFYNEVEVTSLDWETIDRVSLGDASPMGVYVATYLAVGKKFAVCTSDAGNTKSTVFTFSPGPEPDGKYVLRSRFSLPGGFTEGNMRVARPETFYKEPVDGIVA